MKILIAFITICIVMMLFNYSLLHGIVISRGDEVTSGINSYGNYYYIYHKLGFVEYVNQPGNAYYDAYGPRYRYYYSSRYVSSDDFEYSQYMPTYYVNQTSQRQKKRITFKMVWDVFIGICVVVGIITAINNSVNGGAK